MTHTSQPADFILQSFNVFDLNIAREPHQIFSHLQDYRSGVVEQHQLITVARDEAIFKKNILDETRSFLETQSNFATSIGIEGIYSNYTASLQAHHHEHSYQSLDAYNFGCTAILDCGRTYLGNADDVSSIRNSLQPALVAALDAISSLQEAANFTKKYGTHLILGVNLGGALHINITADPANGGRKSAMWHDVRQYYHHRVNNMYEVGWTANMFRFNYRSENCKFIVQAIGGDSDTVAQIDAHEPNTYIFWSTTCSAATVRGISQSREYWRLAQEGSFGRHFLKLYLQLQVLKQSIQYPAYFSRYERLERWEEHKLEVTVDKDYKIIAGGATVTTDSENFLTGSYPSINQYQQITGWIAAAHDWNAYPSDPGDEFLTAWAVAVYDPADLLKVMPFSSPGSNPGVGADHALATVAKKYTLAGGGVYADRIDGEQKFMLQSYPDIDDTNINPNSWKGMVQDYYMPASNVQLTVYAIGMYSEYLSITPQITKQTIDGVQHGNAVASTTSAIASGGVKISDVNGFGNLVQQSYPSSATSWAEYNKDTGGKVSTANATAYAITFDVDLHGVG